MSEQETRGLSSLSPEKRAALVAYLRDSAYLTDKAIQFMDEFDGSDAEEAAAEVMLLRMAADEIEAGVARVEAAEKERAELWALNQSLAQDHYFARAEAAEAERDRLREALERIEGMAERPVCPCGRPTGTPAIKSCARAALAAAAVTEGDQETDE